MGATRNTLAGAMVGYGFVSFVLAILIDSLWIAHAPRDPAPALGLTLAHCEHGLCTYFSKFQTTAESLMFGSSIPSCFIGFLIMRKKMVLGGFSRWRLGLDDPQNTFKHAALVAALITPVFLLALGPYVVRALNSSGFVVRSL